MPRTASKTASIYTRIDPSIKEQAECILATLGIPMSNAVEIFLRQIVIQRKIPFELKAPSVIPVAVGALSKKELDAELQKGVDDINAGRVSSADDVEKTLREEFGL